MTNNEYKPWTDEADNELRRLFCSGLSNKELANHFGRSEGAISSRIRHLGLNSANYNKQQSPPHIGANKQQNNMNSNDIYEHPYHGRVRKHFATGLEVSEDGLLIEKQYSDPHTGDTKSFSPKVLEDANGRSYINWSDKKVYIDEMICSCFHGKRKGGQNASPVHIDGDLTNNHANNLKWQ